MEKYDYLIVGAGLYGAVFAYEMGIHGKKCLVIDKRSHIGGNIYTENIENIEVHTYGAHIFHTNNHKVWRFINKFANFNGFINSPIADNNGAIYNLPFNMNTFYALWGAKTPEMAKKIINEQIKNNFTENPKNLEEQAINMVGVDIYNILIKDYTEKQWGRSCKELPASIIKRIPVRFTYDNNYFNALYQGIPMGGYTSIIEKMLVKADVLLCTDYFTDRKKWDEMAKRVLFTGTIDSYYEYCYGALHYRNIRFETEILDMDNFQGNAVVNYTNKNIPFTRIIEHKHFDTKNQTKTVISREYSKEWRPGDEPFYPIHDAKNIRLYNKYRTLNNRDDKVIFGGRLGEYCYYDMDTIIELAQEKAHAQLEGVVYET